MLYFVPSTSRLPVPTSTSLPDNMLNRKRVKSAPGKVAQVPSQSLHSDSQTLSPSAQVPDISTQRKDDVNGEVIWVPKTQPKKKAGSRRNRESREGREGFKTAERHEMKRKTSKPKVCSSKLNCLYEI